MTDQNRDRASCIRAVQIVQGDITRMNTQAIVNAANSSLLGGGGVDGAIHRAAGPGLLEECRTLGGCPAGEARLTRGYRLQADHVIHTGGPVYTAVDPREARNLLSACYTSCLTLACDKGIRSLAFPAISCGAYGYPFEEACAIALDTTLAFLAVERCPETVVFVLFSPSQADLYRKALSTRADGVR